jgi:hypothetical protein
MRRRFGSTAAAVFWRRCFAPPFRLRFVFASHLRCTILQTSLDEIRFMPLRGASALSARKIE